MLSAAKARLLLSFAGWAVVALLAATNGAEGSSLALHPGDVSVAMGMTLPLACAAATSGQVVWERSNGSSDGLRVNTTTYTGNSGRSFQIGTLILCNIGFEEAGVYACVNTEDNSREMVTVGVHTSSISYFQLQLTEVQNCGQWLLDDSGRATKTGELTSLVLGQALGSLCSTAASSCLITEQFFDCDQDLSANSVTFRARLEHRSTDPAVSADASPLIAQIGSWISETPSITLNNQRLRFITSCPVGISGATDSYCPAIPSTASSSDSSSLSEESSLVVGTTIGVVVAVCALTVIFVVILQLVCWKAMKPHSNRDSVQHKLSVHQPLSHNSASPEGSQSPSEYIQMSSASHYDEPNTLRANKAALAKEMEKDAKKPAAGEVGETLADDNEPYYY